MTFAVTLEFLGPILALSQVFVYVLSVTKVKTNHRINIGQIHGWILVSNFFRGRPL